MTDSRTPDTTTATPLLLLPGAEIVAAIRSLLIWGVVAATAAGMFIRGSHSSCSGGVASSGDGYIGADGAPTDVEPLCGTVTMSPSPLLFVIMAFIVIGSLTRVLRRADDVPQALGILNNARMALVVVTLVALAVSWIAIMTLHVDDWRSFSLFSPFPFGQFDVETTPITQR
ncbi:hypothetical protein [Microbacterium trichothecenolyticum]|uniref:Cell division protein FtsK n=1 Tax=Microbacterium trichothecenolyticum TaxID=69370 RepID=A0ABU0TVW5_MICTR|nr:hypothetical protein [Microbacterium trichothecenolyticum]MDQ1123802.1 hypothetical protein [Microbacterium trichothecenolyticum]